MRERRKNGETRRIGERGEQRDNCVNMAFFGQEITYASHFPGIDRRGIARA